jgi:phosphoglycolate phosphatase
MEGLKKPSAVLFDWDGTLVDTLEGIRAAHDHVRISFGQKTWDDEEFAENILWSARDLFPRLYGDQWEKAHGLFYDHVRQHHIGHLKPLPGARDLLEVLKAEGIPAAIVSNKKQDYIEREVAHLGWRDYFFHVVGAGVAKRDKPEADPILWALERAAEPYPPETVWFVGDTETDLKAARAAGCLSVLVTHGIDRKGLIQAFNPIIVLKDCSELVNLFTKYENIHNNA